MIRWLVTRTLHRLCEWIDNALAPFEGDDDE